MYTHTHKLELCLPAGPYNVRDQISKAELIIATLYTNRISSCIVWFRVMVSKWVPAPQGRV